MLIFCVCHAAAQRADDPVKIYFSVGSAKLDPALRGNRQALAHITETVNTSKADSTRRIQRIELVGGASPEGGVETNKRLSERRAAAVFSYLLSYWGGKIDDVELSSSATGGDWQGLLALAEADGDLPYRTETIGLLREIVSNRNNDEQAASLNLRRLKQLHGGTPYKYIRDNLFPELRSSTLRLKLVDLNESEPIATAQAVTADTITVHDTVYVTRPCVHKPFYMAAKTNLLYDALLLPNIGVEFYLCRNLSIAADWTYGWWRNNDRHLYWRAYGGDIALRWWFGAAARRKPLTGHHIGLYGSVFTYDFETGGKGYMGGKPGGTLWDKMNYAAGVEYGYSLPVARRLNLDFSIGVGYWGGTYYEYKPMDDCYVWQSTKQRHWVGPTKAEISLVWLIGHGNRNTKKGCAR